MGYKKSLCYCHRSRQVLNMRHCWNKLFFVIIRVVVVINQTIIMSPFIYFKNSNRKLCSSAISPLPENTSDYPNRLAVTWKFRIHRFVTGLAIFLLIFYAAASPIMIKMTSDLYSTTRRNQDNLFIIIANFIMTIDMLRTLFILASHIWLREVIVQLLNSFNELLLEFANLDKNFVDFKILLALGLKVALSIYEMVSSLPYLFLAAPHLPTASIVAFLFTHFLQAMGTIFDLNIFTFILLFLTCSMQLEKELQHPQVISDDLKVSQLIGLQNSLHQLIELFRNTFQFGIFLTILLHFVAILCNIYAMLDYYVTTRHLYVTFVIYMISMALEMYSLILVTYLCNRSQRKVKDLFLQREELYLLKPLQSFTLIETDMLWPQLHEFQLLGSYTVNNEFALFLLTYSINFIIIILEFEINKAHK